MRKHETGIGLGLTLPTAKKEEIAKSRPFPFFALAFSASWRLILCQRLGAIVVACVNAACRAPQPLPPPLPAATVALSSEDLPAATRVELAIADLRELVSEDEVEVIISGLVVNRGTRPTTSVLVELRALDSNGLTLRAARVTPTTEHIPPQGGSARFSAVFPNDPAVVDYHIEAIGYGRGIAE